MYSAVLIIHSWLRWAALVAGVAATLNAIRHRGDTSGRRRGHRWDWFFMLTLDLQALVGLILYFGFSPFTREAIANVELALRDSGLRFWTITHVATMVVALVAVRIGRVMAISEPPSAARRNARVASFAIALAAMVAGVPWPGLANGRPLFRL